MTGQLRSCQDEFVCVLVCQETVWEAFKIFWDRLPDRDEYQDWVGRCKNGSISVMDIGSFFSQSEEHINLIKSVSVLCSTRNCFSLWLCVWVLRLTGWCRKQIKHVYDYKNRTNQGSLFIIDDVFLSFRELPWRLRRTGQCTIVSRLFESHMLCSCVSVHETIEKEKYWF